MQFNKEDIDIGERLRGVRENMHMTREEFSEKIDITDSFLGQIERGERSLSNNTLVKIVKFTGVSADYILFQLNSCFFHFLRGFRKNSAKKLLHC